MEKYNYVVGLTAEEAIHGLIALTKEEAKLVAMATNPLNWTHTDGGGYCGSFWIDVANPQKIGEEFSYSLYEQGRL